MYTREEVRTALENGALSQGLLRLEVFARLGGAPQTAAWAERELRGSFETTPVKEMPKYREVTVDWRTISNESLRVEDPRVAFIYQMPLGTGVEELEQKRAIGIMETNAKLVEMIHHNLGVRVASYMVHPAEIEKVLAGIRSEALRHLERIWELAGAAKPTPKEVDRTDISGNPVPVRNDRVFVIHGRNKPAVDAMKLFLRAIGLEGMDFEAFRATLPGTMPIIDVIRSAFGNAQAILVVWTPDERAELHPSLNEPDTVEAGRWQPRPNVILETGAAVIVHPERTLIVSLGTAATPSDLDGLHRVSVDNKPERRRLLRETLKQICPAANDSHDYHDPATAGDFEACVQPPRLPKVTVRSAFEP